MRINWLMQGMYPIPFCNAEGLEPGVQWPEVPKVQRLVGKAPGCLETSGRKPRLVLLQQLCKHESSPQTSLHGVTEPKDGGLSVPCPQLSHCTLHHPQKDRHTWRGVEVSSRCTDYMCVRANLAWCFTRLGIGRQQFILPGVLRGPWLWARLPPFQGGRQYIQRLWTWAPEQRCLGSDPVPIDLCSCENMLGVSLGLHSVQGDNSMNFPGVCEGQMTQYGVLGLEPCLALWSTQDCHLSRMVLATVFSLCSKCLWMWPLGHSNLPLISFYLSAAYLLGLHHIPLRNHRTHPIPLRNHQTPYDILKHQWAPRQDKSASRWGALQSLMVIKAGISHVECTNQRKHKK